MSDTGKNHGIPQPIFNLVKYGTIDYDALDNDFTWVHVKCDDWGSFYKLLNTLKLGDDIRSQKTNGYMRRDVYIMAIANRFDAIVDTMESECGKDYVSQHFVIEQLRPGRSELSLVTILQLMINSLGNSTLDDASNPQGRFFKVVKKSMDTKREVISQIIALEFKFDEAPQSMSQFSDIRLDYNVCTFNNSVYGDIKWGKSSKKESIPRYRYLPSSGMQVSSFPFEDDGNAFVMKSRHSIDKTHLDMLNWTRNNKISETDDPLKGIEINLEESRSVVVFDVIRSLNDRFGDYFGGISLYQCEAERLFTDLDRSYLERLMNHFAERTIQVMGTSKSKKPRDMVVCIYNKAEGKYQKLLEEFVQIVKTRYNVEMTPTEGPRFGMYNIPLIHMKKFYENNPEVKDPHMNHDYALMQHVTVENLESAIKQYNTSQKSNNTRFEKRKEKWLEEDRSRKPEDYESETGKSITQANMPLAEVLFEQLYIKEEIENQEMRFYDWKGFGAEGDWMFGIPLFHMEKRKKVMDGFAYYVIHKDGKMETPVKCDLINFTAPAQFVNLDWNNIEYAVVDPDMNVNIVRFTPIKTLPNATAILQMIEENKRNSRKRTEGVKEEKSKNENFGGCVDIGYIRISDTLWIYYVGQYNNLKQSIANASVVREIEAVDGSRVFFDKIFHMMSIPFVKHNQNSVIPFTIKYLKEWCLSMDYFNPNIEDEDER